jgi:hypothetical protein
MGLPFLFPVGVSLCPMLSVIVTHVFSGCPSPSKSSVHCYGEEHLLVQDRTKVIQWNLGSQIQFIPGGRSSPEMFVN